MTPFSSFWQAGYEGADHINPAGLALSMNDLNQHQARAAEDYAALAPFPFAQCAKASVGGYVSAMAAMTSPRLRPGCRPQSSRAFS